MTVAAGTIGHACGVKVQRGRFLSLTGLWPEGCGIARRAMSFIMPPSAVTSTSSIIIILTTVHPFATSWPSSPKGDARTLRDWLSVSYVTQYPVPPIFSFPLEGKSREAGKGVQGRALIGCSIAILTANQQPQAPPSHFPSIFLAVLLLSGEGVFFFLRRR